MTLLALCLWGAGLGPIHLPQRDSLLVRAESLLGAGNLPAARRIVERLQDRHPDDPQVLVLLGRIHLVWPVIGRYAAESLFTRAVRLSPGDPEPLYYLGKVGVALGGDDGEQIARRGFVPVLAIDPDFRDTWALWSGLYRGDAERRAALAALERHRGAWDADYWRAQLLLELGHLDEAAAALEDVIRRRPDDPGPRAWLARVHFTAGRDSAGSAAYEAALQRSAQDSGQVLWRQIRGIVSSSEIQSFRGADPGDRAAFFRLFWASREPDLSTPLNERLGEHFRRLAEARRFYALLHPSSRYFRSSLFRALSGGVGAMPGGLEGAEARAGQAQCEARLPSVRDAPIQAGQGPRVESSPDSTPNLLDGLDDRGRIFLRHGAPTYRSIGSLADETWCYLRPDGSVLRVTFVRRTGGFGATGDMVVTPVMAGEATSATELLRTDRFTDASTLSFTFWPAAFRAPDRRRTELLVIPDSLRALAVLVDAAGRQVARDSATGRPLHLVGDPGRYLLLLDAVRGGQTGRYRGTVTLPDFGDDAPAVSSLLLAAGDAPPVRDTLETVAPPGLVLEASRLLRVYAELYHMGERDSMVHYTVEYRFERSVRTLLGGRRQRATVIGFARAGAFTPRIVESLVIDPGRLPPGRYRLQLLVTDDVRGVRTGSAVIEFRLR